MTVPTDVFHTGSFSLLYANVEAPAILNLEKFLISKPVIRLILGHKM